MELEKRSFRIENMELRGEDGAPTILRGYAAVFDELSVPIFGFREKIRSGAFSKSLKENNIRALWNHNADMPLGNTKAGTLKLEEDNKGLRFDLELPDNSWGHDTAISVKRGDVDGVSFGFNVIKDEWDHSKKEEPIRTLVSVNLIEISPTPFPAYPATSVDARTALRGYGIDYDRLAQILLRAQGKSLEDEDYRFVREAIGIMEGLTAQQAARYNTDSLRRRLELAERLFI